jgi:hypothetical protein
MRLSDLLGADVRDVDGIVVGRVRDVRLVQDGPVQGTFGAGLRVRGLVVGRVDLGSRLGFRRRAVVAPAIVARPVALLDRGTRYVPWSAVVQIQGRSIELDCAGAELEPPEPVDDLGRTKA